VSEATASSAPTALYVYGVVPAGTKPARGRPGLQLITQDGLTALVGTVSLDEFGEEPLHRNLNDREWLERKAREHEAVLDDVLRSTTVIPFRIATLYGAEENLREFLRGRESKLVELLERFKSKVELGVKAYLDRERAPADGPTDPEVGSGQAYLLRRQAEQIAARDADAFAIECAQASHERLTAAAVDARSNRPQPSELSGRSEQMLLNGAYLVVREDTVLKGAVQELAERYGDRGVTYELTGPWPPYNFVPPNLADA